MSNGVKKKSVALTDTETVLVEEFAGEHGLSFSSALRMIIRRWAGFEDERYRITEKGQQALDEERSNKG